MCSTETINCVINWDAVSAVATFAAVCVALYPIYQDYRRRQETLLNVRHRIGMELLAILPAIQNRFQDMPKGPKISSSFSENETRPLRVLEELLSDAVGLSNHQYLILVSVVDKLKQFEVSGSIYDIEAEMLAKHIEELRSSLGKS